MATATATRATRRAIDFTNVKESSGVSKPRMPEGDYKAKIISVTDKPAKDGVDMWEFHIQLVDRASAVYPYFTKLQENQLWKLRNLLIAAGKQVPKKRINVDPNNLVGSVIGITLIDAEYEGREQSEIDGVLPVDELGETEEAAVDDDGDEPETDEDGDLDLDDL